MPTFQKLAGKLNALSNNRAQKAAEAKAEEGGHAVHLVTIKAILAAKDIPQEEPERFESNQREDIHKAEGPFGAPMETEEFRGGFRGPLFQIQGGHRAS